MTIHAPMQGASKVMIQSVLPTSARRLITRQLWQRLGRGDAVWSELYGLGKFLLHHDDEQGVVQFSDRRIRVRFGSDGLFLVVAAKQPKRRLKSVTIDGERMGIKRFVSTQAKTFGHDHATLSEAAGLIGISRQRLTRLIKQRGMTTQSFGSQQYLSRTQIEQLMLRLKNPEQADVVEAAATQQSSMFSETLDELRV